MSEPITRADYAKWLLSCGDLAMHAMFQDWCAHNPAESASPPRVPGASAHPGRVGVESGPGQPIDLAENFETRAQWHDKIGSTKAAADCRQAAAEIRRLRAVIDECQEAAGIPADQAENYFTVPALIADKIVELEDRAAIERRAGIEAAARYHDEQAAEWHELRQEPKAREYDKQHRADAAAIRALADKAPDAARKGG